MNEKQTDKKINKKEDNKKKINFNSLSILIYILCIYHGLYKKKKKKFNFNRDIFNLLISILFIIYE